MNFFTNNKVFILGLLGAIGVALQQFLSGPADIKVIGYAVLMAVVSYFANNLKGDVASLIGILGTDLTSIIPSLINHTPISWLQIAIQTITAAIAVFAITGPTTSSQQLKLASKK